MSSYNLGTDKLGRWCDDVARGFCWLSDQRPPRRRLGTACHPSRSAARGQSLPGQPAGSAVMLWNSRRGVLLPNVEARHGECRSRDTLEPSPGDPARSGNHRRSSGLGASAAYACPCSGDDLVQGSDQSVRSTAHKRSAQGRHLPSFYQLPSRRPGGSAAMAPRRRRGMP